ncbi:hypothetical protein GYB22_01885 [bacterium]|nr:hypothetical protein [bacterium]
MRGTVLCLLIILISNRGFSQWNAFQPLSASEYGLSQKLDSNRAPLSRAQKATILSAVIPGAGQIYNKKYWKAGIVYAGAAGLIYVFKTNTDSLNAYNTALGARIDGDSTTIDMKYPLLSTSAVQSNRDFHRRLRDISILGFVGLYALQIIDANVDAHLYEFKVNDDLSMQVRPTFNPDLYLTRLNPGLRVSFRF